MASKKEQVLKKHPYKITPPAFDTGRWQTYYKDTCGKRKIIRARSEQEIIDKLISVYLSGFVLSHLTYIASRSTELTICFLNRSATEFNLSRKEWNNIKTILNGMFYYAVRKKYISENPMDVEHTKTHQDRYVILVPKALEILNKIEHTGEYIFMRGSDRIVSRQIAYVLEKYAERQGVKTKSTHKMRKTYASNLSANGVPIDCIREMLGHNNLSTTLGYIYNPLSESETYDLIAKAL